MSVEASIELVEEDVIVTNEPADFYLTVKESQISLNDLGKCAFRISKYCQGLFTPKHHAKLAVGVHAIWQR